MVAQQRMHLSCAHVGLGLSIRSAPTLYHPGNITIGDNVNFGEDVHVNAAETVTIGSDVLISHRVSIMTMSHDADAPLFRTTQIAQPITLEDGCWLGAHSCILSGVTIGKGAVVGAGAVVTKDVPANAVVAGVPARKIRDKKANLTARNSRADTDSSL